MKLTRLTRLFIVLAGAATLAGGSLAAQAAESKAPRLQRFAGCGSFLDFARDQGRRIVGPYGLGGSGPIALAAAERDAAPVPGVDYSTTNVQEAGVDEPDIVKTDGERIVALAQGRLHVVTLAGGKPRLADSVSFAKPAGQYPIALLLFRDRAVVVSQSAALGDRTPGAAGSIVPVPTRTVLTDVDLGKPGSASIARTLTVDAGYLDARLVGSSLRVVFTSTPPIELSAPDDPGPAGEQKALARNRKTISASRPRDWLPSYVLENRRTGAKRTRVLLGCSHVARPQRFSGLGMLTVVSFDLTRGLVPVDTDGVMSDGQTIYASQESLYVATQRWVEPDPGKPPSRGVTTTIHKLDISHPLRAVYRASGSVAGYVGSQFAMSEYRGVLRVATTEMPAWWGDARTESESFVTTLDERSGELVRIGRVGGLGRGERMYGVRFIEDVGYVVTFRQVDPLYTIDLSRPANPAVRGELKIRGYSAYLHPLAGDLLLGVGQDATEEGRVLGAQMSVFDVSDLGRPQLLARRRLDNAWSEAEWDHHAFLYWPPARVAVLPVQASVVSPGPDRPFSGAVVTRVGRSAIDLVGTISHDADYPVRRSLVVGTTLYTLSESGLKGSSLATLAARSWVKFP